MFIVSTNHMELTMPEQLPRNFAIEIQQKLYEKATPHGNLVVYQTSPYGMMLTVNGHILISEYDSFFYHEMMAHPALFIHPHPKKVAIVGPAYGILQEVLKHTSVVQVCCVTENSHLDEVVSHYFSKLSQTKTDARVQALYANPETWIKDCEAEAFDIIIRNQISYDCLPEQYHHFYLALRANGIFIQPGPSSFLQPNTLKPIVQHIQLAGFDDWQTLNFPQPSYPTGWRTAMMAIKCPEVKRIREKDIFNRNFTTRYYNFDTHKAALALPEFMREELGMTE